LAFDREQFKRVMVVVAHTDDEVIFFGSLISWFAERGAVLVVAMSAERRGAFDKVMQEVGVEWWSFTSAVNSGRAQRLSTQETMNLVKGVQSEFDDFQPDFVVSHGRTGEYGHQYHIATHTASLCVARNMKTPFLERSSEGDVVFDVEPRKAGWLKEYDLPKPQSWNKYINKPERYLCG